MDASQIPTQPIPSQDESVPQPPLYAPSRKQRTIVGTLTGFTGKTAINHPVYANDDIVVGRLKTCPIVVDSLYASNKHARIYTITSDLGDILVFCEDLSSNGTFWNGRKIGKGKSILLSTGDSLEIRKGTSLSYKQFSESTNLPAQTDTEFLDTKYQLTSRVLGSGAYATVYLAVDKETKQQLACKVMDKEQFQVRGKSNFVKETQILQSLSHPNVVQILDVLETERRVYIFLELVSGGDLFNLVKENGLIEECEAKFLFYQLLLAIKYLHDNSITHRDLKPENVLVATPEHFARLMVSDFGMARQVNTMSMMKSIVGTVTYVAPEVLETKYAGRTGYGKSADCWSLGVLLYVMLSATHPFGDVDDSDDEQEPEEDQIFVRDSNYNPKEDLSRNLDSFRSPEDSENNLPGNVSSSSKIPQSHKMVRAPTDMRILERIAAGQVEFPDNPWSSISRAGISLVKGLMEPNPEKRLTVDEALAHEWIASKKDELEQIYEQKVEEEWNIKSPLNGVFRTMPIITTPKVKVKANKIASTPYITPPLKRQKVFEHENGRTPLRERELN